MRMETKKKIIYIVLVEAYFVENRNVITEVK